MPTKIIILSGVCLACASCQQLSQQVVGSIPPPAPETLVRPIPEIQQEYYTLPSPIGN